jgi:hypothetical protein
MVKPYTWVARVDLAIDRSFREKPTPMRGFRLRGENTGLDNARAIESGAISYRSGVST